MALTKIGAFTFDHTTQSDRPAWAGATAKTNLNQRTEDLKTHYNDTAVTEITEGKYNYGESSTGTDAYAVTIANIASYGAGLKVSIKSDVANTGAASCNVNSLGAVDIRKNGTTVLSDGDIPAGGIAKLEHDGTYFQLTNPVAHAVNVTANRLVVSDGSGNMSASSVTDTEAGYLSGVTSAIQTQLSAKAAASDLTSHLAESATQEQAGHVKIAAAPVAEQTPAALISNPLDGASQSIAGPLAPTILVPSGLTGAVAASRYVGATASGAPASGTFAVGDFVIDQTGKIWVCTVAGTPGTWGSGAQTTKDTFSDTTTTIAANSNHTKTIPVGFTGKKGRLILAGDSTGQLGAIVHFTDVQNDAMSLEIEASGDTSRVYVYSIDAALSSVIFGGSWIKLLSVYISGTNLIIVFKNANPTTQYTLNVRACLWEVEG